MTDITRREFLKSLGMGAAALALPRGLWSAEPAGDKPNIIVIMADDVSAREFACYGHEKHKTPVLDGLAKTGVRFETCWCTPLCSPSRAEIMTGRYGFRTGWYHNSLRSGNLAEGNEVFSELLKRGGYKTAVCGKWQLPGTYQQHGFDEHCMWLGTRKALRPEWKYDGPVEKKGMQLPGRLARYWHPAICRNGKLLATTAKHYGPDIFVDFLLDFARRNRKGPFLVYYPMCLPHISWDFEAGRGGYLPVPELNARGRKTGRKVRGSLKSNVEYVDALVGRIVRGLEDLGVRRNTVVLFTGDNGTSAYGKARTRQERGPRVPMIVNCPGIVKARGAVDTLVDFSDVLPTLCELAGVSLPKDYAIDGRSFAPALRGTKFKEREWIFSYLFDRRFLRDKRWLLDGDGRFYDCGSRRNERRYRDVTGSKKPGVVAARERFKALLSKLPPPPRELVEKARREGRRFLPPKR
jgi:arylsulfatase A-like enzyme